MSLPTLGACVTADAAGRLTSDSDIVGLTTTMTGDQARQFIERQFGAFALAPQAIRVEAPGYGSDISAGFSADITSNNEADKNQPPAERGQACGRSRFAVDRPALCSRVAGDFVRDTLDVYVDPNAGASGILAFVRNTGYAVDREIPETVFIQALVDKFGEPLFTDDLQNYYWAEGVSRPYGDDWWNCVRFSNEVASLQDHFPILMNEWTKDAAAPPKCAMYLKAHLVLVTSPDDVHTRAVTAFSMALVNVRASYNALNAYAAGLAAAANKTRQGEQLREPQNKTRL